MPLKKRRVPGMLKYEIINTPIVLLGSHKRFNESGETEWDIRIGDWCLNEDIGPLKLSQAEYEAEKFIEECFKTAVTLEQIKD